ncbi:MAG: hypothetical protein ACOC2Q_01765 [Spirochaetota bacterium]
MIRLFASPARKGAVIAGKLVSTAIMVFVQLAMLFVAFTVIRTTITMFMAIVRGAFGFRLGGTVRPASMVYWGADAFEELSGGGTSIWNNVVALGLFAAVTSLIALLLFVRRLSR